MHTVTDNVAGTTIMSGTWNVKEEHSMITLRITLSLMALNSHIYRGMEI